MQLDNHVLIVKIDSTIQSYSHFLALMALLHLCEKSVAVIENRQLLGTFVAGSTSYGIDAISSSLQD